MASCAAHPGGRVCCARVMLAVHRGLQYYTPAAQQQNLGIVLLAVSGSLPTGAHVCDQVPISTRPGVTHLQGRTPKVQRAHADLMRPPVALVLHTRAASCLAARTTSTSLARLRREAASTGGGCAIAMLARPAGRHRLHLVLQGWGLLQQVLAATHMACLVTAWGRAGEAWPAGHALCMLGGPLCEDGS